MNYAHELARSKEIEKEALEQCATEPVHIPGAIQHFAFLIAFHDKTLEVAYVSANIDSMLDMSLERVLTANVNALFDRELKHIMLNACAHQAAFRQREHVVTHKIGQRLYDISLFRTGDFCVLEFIPMQSAVAIHTEVMAKLKWLLAEANHIKKPVDILNYTVRRLRNITEYGRVMAYQFLSDGSGEVVAESKSPILNPFLGLRFPDYDIPAQAKALFKQIPIRIIANTREVPVPIRHNVLNAQPLDLTLAVSRATSPVHAQYLRNMEVTSSLTLPIIIENELWGLFSLHHPTKKTLSPEIIYTCELAGQTINLSLEYSLKHAANQCISKHIPLVSEFLAKSKNRLTLDDFWAENATLLSDIITCDGVAYQFNDVLLTTGDCPADTTIALIAEKLAPEAQQVVCCEQLSSYDFADSLNKTAGVLMFYLDIGYQHIAVMFFRNEIKHNIRWAGSPQKTVVADGQSIRLHPRSSFCVYEQSKAGYSDAWRLDEKKIASLFATALKRSLETTCDREQRRKDEHNRLRVVIRELNHRVRNILTLIRSISKQTIHTSSTVENYATALEDRIIALSEASDLLTRNRGNHVPLRELIDKELAPYSGQNELEISINGPQVKVSSSLIPILILVIHEVVSNAVKYGALSVKGGRVMVDWRFEHDNFIFNWTECNGPVVCEPTRNGFGKTIIENAINYEFSGGSEIVFAPEGVKVNFWIPAAVFASRQDQTFVDEQLQVGSEHAKLSLQDINRVLILEDNFMAAEDLKSMLASFTEAEVIAIPSQADAIQLLEEQVFDLLFLDVNLKESTCLQVAQQCEAQGLHFVYLTGYGKDFLEDKRFPQAPVLIKPARCDEVKSLLSSL